MGRLGRNLPAPACAPSVSPAVPSSHAPGVDCCSCCRDMRSCTWALLSCAVPYRNRLLLFSWSIQASQCMSPSPRGRSRWVPAASLSDAGGEVCSCLTCPGNVCPGSAEARWAVSRREACCHNSGSCCAGCCCCRSSVSCAWAAHIQHCKRLHQISTGAITTPPALRMT